MAWEREIYVSVYRRPERSDNRGSYGHAKVNRVRASFCSHLTRWLSSFSRRMFTGRS